jgi:hypothetical protein
MIAIQTANVSDYFAALALLLFVGAATPPQVGKSWRSPPV